MSDQLPPQETLALEEDAGSAPRDATALPDGGEAVSSTRRINTRGLSLRAFAARGVIVNSAFDAGISALGLIRGFVVAAFLTRADYGIWGILVVSLGVLAGLKVIGIGDKYIQQEEPDQELAFQKAFTLEVLMTAAALVPLAAALPVVAIIYNQWSVIAPGVVLLTVLAAGALQAPFWIYYREMNFMRQRSLAAVEPLVGFVVAVGLAIAGAGYWSLALGITIGAWAGALVAIIASPYRLRWRYDKGSLRAYANFSGPIIVATLCTIITANFAVLAANAHLGIAAVGVIALASQITAFTTRVDDLVGGTLYPAICAVQNRLDLLRESFVKSNRLALIWAVPFGFGIALFAADVVQFGIGVKWRSAIGMLQITGVVAAVGQLGWNWDAYFRARGNTMPLAVANVASTVIFLAVGLPLLFSDGLRGLAIGIGVMTAVHVAFRAWYLARLFQGFAFIRHAMKAMLPSVPAVAVVLLARAFESGPRSLAIALAELVAYVLVTVAATWWFEGGLVREAIAYLIERAPRSASPAG